MQNQWKAVKARPVMFSRFRLVSLLLLAACASAPETREAADSLDAVIADHWALVLEEDPVLAAQLGDDAAEGRLPDTGLDAYWRGVEVRRALLDRLRALPRPPAGSAAWVNREVLDHHLDSAIRAAGHNGHYLTITTYSAPHSALVSLAGQTTIESDADAAAYLERLRGADSYLAGAVSRLAEAVEEGWTQPCRPMEGFERTYRAHLEADLSESVFLAPFSANAPRRAEAAMIVETEILPALEAFGRFYETTYRPACRTEPGISSLPGGEAFYQDRVRTYTTTDLTAQEVHRLGLAEVARIRAEMARAAEQAGFGSLAAYQEHLRTDPAYYPKSGEARLAAAAVIAKKMDGQLVRLFGRLPRTPYDVRPIPLDRAAGTTTAYYMPPAADGSRAGSYMVNTTSPESRPLYELEALTLHEAVPGHHLQIALAMEEELPPFRRHLGITAFTEGWALYAESLGAGVGFYATPETRFGALSYEMWRACRLVVDTGIHAYGWDRDRAIAYMLENTGLSRVNIEREVDRYITWPGQALAYKVGELKIQELRARAEAELGEGFDLRRFNDAVLAEGALPLLVLEERIEQFIARERGSRP